MAANNPIPDRTELQISYDLRRPDYDEVLSDIYRKVSSLLEAHGYTPTIKYRVKRFKNYFGKLQKVQASGTSGRITDLLGLRIICPFLEDLDMIEALLTKHFQIIEAERKGGGQNSFREFGYDSVHLLLKLKDSSPDESVPFCDDVCEIQLRTILQDAWAEVEHELVYKSDITLPNESIKRKLASLNASLTLSDLIFQEIRDYQKEIRHRGRKRRESIEETLLDQETTLSHQTGLDAVPARQIGPIPYSLASGLEKTMLAALNAHSQNDLKTAIDLYGQLLKMNLETPIKAMVYNHRGMAYFSRGEFKQASRDFSEALHFDAESFRGLANRALAYRMLKEFDHSIEDYNQALSIDPSNFEGYFGRAQTYFEIQLYSKALSDCEKALAIEPDFAPAQQLTKLISEAFFSVTQKPTSTAG